jgi:hypothetical protein
VAAAYRHCVIRAADFLQAQASWILHLGFAALGQTHDLKCDIGQENHVERIPDRVVDDDSVNDGVPVGYKIVLEFLPLFLGFDLFVKVFGETLNEYQVEISAWFKLP